MFAITIAVEMSFIPLAICAGVASHLAYFNRGEHLILIPRILAAACLMQCCFVAFLTIGKHVAVSLAVQTVILYTAAYLSGLFFSITSYRIWFHPLRDWPGPTAAKISKFYHVYRIRKLDQYRYLQELHNKYGNFVRIGPNEVSIIEPDIVESVHGSQSVCGKGPMYDIGAPIKTLQQFRDQATHDQRKRSGWDKAFSSKALRSYESRINDYSELLVQRLQETKGSAVDVSQWFNWLSFDIMGELTFGHCFGGLKEQRTHWAIDSIHQSNQACGLLGAVPWFLHLMTMLPDCFNPIIRLLKFSEESVGARRQMDVKRPDIMSHLFAAEKFYNDAHLEHNLLMGDARLLIIAGSDTTASALTFLFYHLARDPSVVQKLREELTAHSICTADEITGSALQPLPYLNAVIDETLRLHPPIPSQPVRDSPEGGLRVGEHFIPAVVQILTPAYCIHRSSQAFADPSAFIPERFTTSPRLIRNKSAFFPFLKGTFACIGKQLAYQELRLATTKLVLTFDVAFASDETGLALLEQTKDNFTLTMAPLKLCFLPRAIK